MWQARVEIVVQLFTTTYIFSKMYCCLSGQQGNLLQIINVSFSERSNWKQIREKRQSRIRKVEVNVFTADCVQ